MSCGGFLSRGGTNGAAPPAKAHLATDLFATGLFCNGPSQGCTRHGAPLRPVTASDGTAAGGTPTLQTLDEHRVGRKGRWGINELVQHLVVLGIGHAEPLFDQRFLTRRVVPPLALEGEHGAFGVRKAGRICLPGNLGAGRSLNGSLNLLRSPRALAF